MEVIIKREDNFLKDLENNLIREEISFQVNNETITIYSETEVDAIIVVDSLYEYMFLNEMLNRAIGQFIGKRFEQFIELLRGGHFSRESAAQELLKLFQMLVIETTEIKQTLDIEEFKYNFHDVFDSMFVSIYESPSFADLD